MKITGMNMKIGIISDTHLPKKGKQLPAAVIQALQEADLIIHAGDWSSMEVYEELSHLAPVKGVYGNIETEDILIHFPQKLYLELAGYRIGVVHGDKGKGKTTPDRAFSAFADEKVDLIIFGHSHIPFPRQETASFSSIQDPLRINGDNLPFPMDGWNWGRRSCYGIIFFL